MTSTPETAHAAVPAQAPARTPAFSTSSAFTVPVQASPAAEPPAEASAASRHAELERHRLAQGQQEAHLAAQAQYERDLAEYETQLAVHEAAVAAQQAALAQREAISRQESLARQEAARRQTVQHELALHAAAQQEATARRAALGVHGGAHAGTGSVGASPPCAAGLPASPGLTTPDRVGAPAAAQAVPPPERSRWAGRRDRQKAARAPRVGRGRRGHPDAVAVVPAGPAARPPDPADLSTHPVALPTSAETAFRQHRQGVAGTGLEEDGFFALPAQRPGQLAGRKNHGVGRDIKPGRRCARSRRHPALLLLAAAVVLAGAAHLLTSPGDTGTGASRAVLVAAGTAPTPVTVPAAATAGSSYTITLPLGWTGQWTPTTAGGRHTDLVLADPADGLHATLRSRPAGSGATSTAPAGAPGLKVVHDPGTDVTTSTWVTGGTQHLLLTVTRGRAAYELSAAGRAATGRSDAGDVRALLSSLRTG